MLADRLHNNVWRQIYDAISREKARSEITYGRVIKRDVEKNNVYVDGFGDRPIPMIGYRYKIDYFDTQTTGATPAVGAALPAHVVKRTVVVEPELPRIGDTVMVLRHLGVDRLPKLAGIVLGRDFVI